MKPNDKERNWKKNNKKDLKINSNKKNDDQIWLKNKQISGYL